MEYPKTKKELIAALQGSWKQEGSTITFKIKDELMYDIAGEPENPNGNLEKRDFSIENNGRWTIQNIVLGYHEATIIECDENSFVTQSWTVTVSFNRTTPPPSRPEIRKFIRVNN